MVATTQHQLYLSRENSEIKRLGQLVMSIKSALTYLLTTLGHMAHFPGTIELL